MYILEWDAISEGDNFITPRLPGQPQNLSCYPNRFRISSFYVQEYPFRMSKLRLFLQSVSSTIRYDDSHGLQALGHLS